MQQFQSSVFELHLSKACMHKANTCPLLAVPFFFLASQTSFNPPEPPEDHWELNIPLPKYDVIYKLCRKSGVVCYSLP